MIQIISHRGLWKDRLEKNTLKAFQLSLESNFGIETDIRDLNGEIVISHDCPIQSEEIITLTSFLEIHKHSNKALPLALNIKSDGLQNKLEQIINFYELDNYFVFDMSVPDTINYLSSSIKFFSRHSDIETSPIFYHECHGIWMDEFFSSWISHSDIKIHLENDKKVCLVSPELHGRDHVDAWRKYKQFSENNTHLDFIICTDFPIEARSYFAE